VLSSLNGPHRLLHPLTANQDEEYVDGYLRKVLIVDDELDMLTNCTRILRRCGYSV
jgi:hypothetical protein